MVKSCKRYLLTDTIGLPVSMIVHPVNILDRDGALALLEGIRIRIRLLRLQQIFADAAYAGDKLKAALARMG